MRQDRLLHHYIRDRIDRLLGRRSWAWLAREAEIPQSTLATQKLVPKFSVSTLVAVARVLDRPISDLVPPDHTVEYDHLDRPAGADPQERGRRRNSAG
jgi:hypothetical protein